MKHKKKHTHDETEENPAVLDEIVDGETAEESAAADDSAEDTAKDTGVVDSTEEISEPFESAETAGEAPSEPDIVISEITVTEVVAESVPETSDSTSEAKSAKEESAVREMTPTETKRLHERFRFDWEIEDIEEDLIEALDEDALDLAEPDESEPMPIPVKSVTFAQAAQIAFGLFLLVFSVIGVVATAVKVKQVIDEQNDNSAQIAYFEDFIMPLVASDAPIFEGAQSLNEDVILTAACWDIIFNPSAFYEYSGGNYSVSYLDIDRRITKLFGTGLTYTHKTVGDTELTFEYNEESGMYSIPAFPRSTAYYPDITNITEVDGGYELTVCYRLPITNWIESVNNVEKTLVYTVVPSETDYNIVAMRIIDMAESGEAY